MKNVCDTTAVILIIYSKITFKDEIKKSHTLFHAITDSFLYYLNKDRKSSLF